MKLMRNPTLSFSSAVPFLSRSRNVKDAAKYEGGVGEGGGVRVS